MREKNLRTLPRISDSSSFVYLEHGKIDRDQKAISYHDEGGKVPIPCASLALLMLGPGTSVTHAAIQTLADNGCTILWCGEEGVRMYASGTGLTRSSKRLLHQASVWYDDENRLKIVRKMYKFRFSESLNPELTLQEIRGKEGIRVRECYRQYSAESGVPWEGRSYNRNDWRSADPINRALSSANSCLYGVCHAAIVAAGYSPSIGFVHTGKILSFVYDVADLYKTQTSIPAAFSATAEDTKKLESRVRWHCRDMFRETKLLTRIIKDIDVILGYSKSDDEDDVFADDEAKPGSLWNGKDSKIPGGKNFGDE